MHLELSLITSSHTLPIFYDGVIFTQKGVLLFIVHFRDVNEHVIYIISEETSIFAPQRLPFYMALGVAACTVGKVRASTVFMCVCSTFRPSDFLLFVKNGFVVGVRCQANNEPPADGATTPLSQCYAWLRNAAWLGPPYTIPSAAHQHCIHTRCILSCKAGGRRAARGREGERENRRWEGRREQGAGGREGGRKR